MRFPQLNLKKRTINKINIHPYIKYFLIGSVTCGFVYCYKNRCVKNADNNIIWTNDVTNMNKTPVKRIVQPLNEEDIQEQILKAKENGYSIIPQGICHSMGGQCIVENGVIMDQHGFEDMRQYTIQDNDSTENYIACYRKKSKMSLSDKL